MTLITIGEFKIIYTILTLLTVYSLYSTAKPLDLTRCNVSRFYMKNNSIFPGAGRRGKEMKIIHIGFYENLSWFGNISNLRGVMWKGKEVGILFFFSLLSR